MNAFARCVKILIVEQLREPVGIFWSFIAPVLYLFYRVSPGSFGFASSVDMAVADCLTYIAFFSSANGFMLYLIGRRESGFCRSFLMGKKRLARFLCMQYLASLAIASLSAALFLLVADVFIVDLPARPLIPVFIRYLIFCAIFMFGGMVTSALPLTFQTAGSIFSICLTLIVVFGLAGEAGDGPPHHWIQYFNVFAIARQFLVGGSQPDGIWVAIWLYTVVCIVLGIYGFRHFRMNPEWSNR